MLQMDQILFYGFLVLIFTLVISVRGLRNITDSINAVNKTLEKIAQLLKENQSDE